MTIKNIPIILLLVFASVSCKNKSDKRTAPPVPGKDEMVELNRYFVQKDRERIINFIERKNLKMKESPTGLWYQIIINGEGETFTDNSEVIFDYDCSLLDGTKCYSSKELGTKEVVLGKSKIEAGLNEGLRMLNKGAEAIFIIPPFLAYGLIGDGEKIPSRAIIVYNVSVLRSK